MEPPPMEPPPILAGFAAQSSRKRVLPDIGSTFMDSDVTEISASVFLTAKTSKQKVALQEVIDLDDNEDSTDLMVLDEKIDTKNKGKAVKYGYDGSSSQQGKESSENSTPGSQDSANLDLYDDHYDDLMETYLDIDELASMQAYFDNANIPSGIEATLPWSATAAPTKKMMSYASNLDVQPANSNLHNSGNSMDLSSKMDSSSGLLFQQPTASLQSVEGNGVDVKSSKTWWTGPFTKLKKPYSPKFPKSSKFWLESDFGNSMSFPTFNASLDATVHLPTEEGSNIPGGQDCKSNEPVDEGEILRKFEVFKQFDTVEDYSDHHYAAWSSYTKEPSKNWVRKIQEEWKILEKDLPDRIYVRVYESRMDLLRAVIVGAEGTPYHDGLFFFDVSFPSSYPNVPPHVHYHSGGLRLNPNLYNCGKVCLSLLNTWSGGKNEKWMPRVSTMLQVLVSIQALILNQKPFFNEPGYARMNGTPKGEIESLKYNENTFTLSLKTMLYTMRRPPKHFEDFVVGHFYTHAHDILVACKAYVDGAQVGCLVKGGVQDVDEGDKSCSKHFKDSLPGYINMLVKEFSKIGVEDTEKFVTDPKKILPVSTQMRGINIGSFYMNY